jgi:hypothetical protein
LNNPFLSAFNYQHQFFKRVKKAHTWEVPPLDQKEVESLENEDDEKTRQKLADSLLNTNESEYSLEMPFFSIILALFQLLSEHFPCSYSNPPSSFFNLLYTYSVLV